MRSASAGHLVALLGGAAHHRGEITPLGALLAQRREHRLDGGPAVGVELELVEPGLVAQRVRENAAQLG